ncbi:hypothetical protein [Sphingopyxis sp. PET50]|uniref:hypothetical protein n=1 Tax=Sphingopyxis sp. PET50 TaxID=2976533 RepID=UPI0028ADAE25|nr:hypothetical protein [Sphingopyxis sp. PET50]
MTPKRGFAPGRHIAPVRFLIFAAVLVVASGAACAMGCDPRTALLLGFDAAAFVFLASIVPLLSSDAAAMRCGVRRTMTRTVPGCLPFRRCCRW